MKKQSIFIVIIILTALAAGIWREKVTPPAALLNLNTGTLLTEPKPLPAFALVDFEGTPFTKDSLKAHWSVVFFGYTSCANICPATLHALNNIAQRLTRLPMMQYVFITIDPSIDDRARLKDYLQQTSLSKILIKGLTGDKDQIREMSQALGVYIEQDPEGKSDVSHSGTLFLIDPEGNLAAVFTESSKPHAIAHDVKEIIHHYALASTKRNAS